MTSEVRKTSAAVDAMAENWPLIDALMGGTKAMRRAGKTYLPQWPAEEDKSYQIRLKVTTLFPAFERTVAVMTGKPFSKPITIGEDVPKRIIEWLENVDREGRNLHAFAAELCQEGLGWGFGGILVDSPTVDGTVRTLADEQKAGVRPYFVHVRHADILGWRCERLNGEMSLTQLRILERVEVADGQFGVKLIDQVRVLEPGRWAVHQKAKADDDDSWVEIKSGVTSIAVIPFVPIYGKRKEFMVGLPPLLELAHQNVEHWQSKSDQQNILHVARVPILFGKDIGNSPMSVGAGALIVASSKDADLKYVEHSGAAIEAGRVSILDLEDRMRQTGAELLVIKPGNTTEVQTVADNEQGMCDLQRMMQTLENALDQALGFMAMWVKEAAGGHVTIYRDFGAATLAEASAELLHKMKDAGNLSFATLLNELKRRGILSPDIDVDAEMTKAIAEKPVETEEVQVRV